MPNLNGKGPEEQGSGTGRKLGKCSRLSDEGKLSKLAKEIGQQRKSKGETGKGTA